MDLTEETFRDLARTSPWRWRSVHLVRESEGPPSVRGVEAWIRRPDLMLVVDEGTHVVRGATDEVEAERGTDPMWESYDWVAMLAPVELADGEDDRPGTTLTDLRQSQRRGRLTWWTRAVPTDAYWPRCGCCPLLWSEVSDRNEYGSDDTPFVPTADYPTSYEVALDVESGICVEVSHVGGDRPSPDLDVTILAVNEEYPDALFVGPSI
ncbi:hypothetical protein [Janibacter limosus]|uniref:hypothetical protein n=1 Tax=Janibacter limosus TaxID=53458 RepID=UPI0008356169|nr:hypothetical protein [Janibacter limosus]